jgi:hypothetical protein
MAEDRNNSGVNNDTKMSIAAEMFEPYSTTLWEPDTRSYAYGTSSELEQKLKLAGINLRRELLKTSLRDINAWKALVCPPSVHQSTLTLAEMIAHIPDEDKEQFSPLGEAGVVMPLRMMEKYLLPTIKLMEHLHANGLNDLPGELEVAAMYSFFLQGQLYPKERVKEDLEVLKATTITDDFGLRGQLQSEASNVEATAAQMRTILLNLQKARSLHKKGKEYLHKKQEEANNLIALYLTQHQADYATVYLMGKKITMLSHLVQKQSIENLELNQRVIEAYEQADLSFEEAIYGPIVSSQTALNNEITRLLLDNNTKINNALRTTKDPFNQYDANDMKAVLDKSKESVTDLVAKNSVLVAENSKLRMHLSLMPVQYRDFAAHHQQTNSTLYQDQRRDPKVIIPRSTHLKGGEIVCAPAPMSHPSVQECMRDAVYTTLGQSKVVFDQAFKLKKPRTKTPSAFRSKIRR